MSAFELALVALAAARITRLITTDDAGMVLRVFLQDHLRWHYTDDDGITHRFGDALTTCPWCIGFWVSVLTVTHHYVMPDPWNTILLAPWAVSYLVGTAEMWNSR